MCDEDTAKCVCVCVCVCDEMGKANEGEFFFFGAKESVLRFSLTCMRTF